MNLKATGRSAFLTALTCAILWIFLAAWLHAQDAPFHNAPPSSVQQKNPYAGQQTAVEAGAPDKGMPSWNTLPGRQRWQLVTYLRSFKGSGGA
jgi:hypothetical protein